MAEKADLIKKRGSFKGRLTAFVNYTNTLSEKTLSSLDAKELQLRMGKLESLYEQYDQVQLQLECLVENVDLQLTEREDFESQYYTALATAQDILCDFNKRNDECAASEMSTRRSNHKLVKLPTIQLPKFSGSYENWLEFHDTFTSLIHSNDDIDEINKFHYLRASLEGSAAVVIQSIDFSSSNYATAWKLLCERFNNKRLLIQNHVSALFNIENITKESSVTLKHLIDQLNKNLRALESLGEPVKQWDTLLIYIVTHKLDHKTYREWEEHKGRVDTNGSSISFDTFIKFIRNRADLIETLELSRTMQPPPNNKSNSKYKAMVSVQKSNHSQTDSTQRTCFKCQGDHNLSSCPQFLALTNDARLKLLPSYKICYNCFKKGHFSNTCKNHGCKICKRRHNTLIHISEPNKVIYPRTENSSSSESATLPTLSPSAATTTDTSTVALSANVSSSSNKQHEVLLSTALIKLCDNDNREHIVRAVLDCGSTSCLITDRLVRQLNLPTNQVDKSILGINNVTSHVGKTCRVSMKSLSNSFSADIHCFVLPSITNNVPGHEIDITSLKIPSNICLADPIFYKPAEVDILIGADLFWDMLGSQQIKLGKNNPVLCETKLGWIISGPISSNNYSLSSSDLKCNFTKVGSFTDSHVDDIQGDLMRFWQLEEVNPNSPHYFPEEKRCEEHFKENTTRLDDGRFCVRLPLKHNPNVVGDSYQRAKQCLYSLERRLKTKPELSQMYHDFMAEYQSLDHMSECEQNEKAHFIPHHGVLREGSITTKLRVVYNASSPTSTGVSFNEIQMVGPTVQDDLLSILLRFRQHKYILCADINKFYRQIIVHPSDRYLQQVLWRESNDACEPIKTFQLNTVTYGTASAPFLATRCLKQVGLDCKNDKISEIITHDFYVDDLLTGADDLHEVKVIREEVTDALMSACMPLRKWKSNEPELVSEDTGTTHNLNIGGNEPDKLLGLGWHADSDELCFPIRLPIPKSNTKRDLLSAIAQIFDPLGLLAPCVIIMKMLMQQLWLHKLSWDDSLTPDIQKQWDDIVTMLPILNEIRIPRIIVCDSYNSLDLHIFTDASERAYGACVYVRSTNNKGEVSVRLLMAKSRVAPIKPTTIPRLELCGVLVGARLYEKVTKSLRARVNQVYFWTDSTIVLGWLRMLPSKLQPFVRNRVAEILEKAGNCTWQHVPTDKNSADLISRGVDIRTLHNHNLWWFGPEFLKQDVSEWPPQPKHLESLPETRPDVSLNITVDNPDNRNDLIDFSRFSNYNRIVRSVAYVLRFIRSCRKQPIETIFLGEEDLRNALQVIILKCQDESFPEYRLLYNKQNLSKKSPLLKYNVFLDENNIMRVGGRLGNSNFSFDKKYPILLQSTHAFTKLLFDFEHKRLMHAGPQLLLASIRETYWPIGGRNLAKASYHKCVRCSRMRGRILTPLMGNLPQDRILPGGYPFENTGVDYAGPVMSASRQGRGCRLVKVYIAIFICFSTKAVHLELVGDLTSKHYLLALRRFISRRGKPFNIYSDNGTSFVGAHKEISNFLKINCNSLSEGMSNDGINFKFIPAYTPHFGGLWEAGVKSTKYHLKRVLGNCNLTYEELNTTLVQIEAILNSRPLTPLSSDPADCTPLTPGHFLIGRPLTSLPEKDHQNQSTNHLTRFHRIEQLRQHFWVRWSKEYVAELQQRTKWRSCKNDLKLNTLVVVKDDNLPPMKWKLGRIVAVHPGADKIARVADIKTSTGVIRRAFSKICPLPVSSSESG